MRIISYETTPILATNSRLLFTCKLLNMEDKHLPDFETKTRAFIAIGLLASIIAIMGYTLYVYGHILAVLTLILGWATGTANVLLSPYFGSPTAGKKPDGNPTVNAGDNTTVVTGDAKPAEVKE